jgi:hypothetical protein
MAGWHGQFKKKPCVVCGAFFQPKSGVHKFCCDSCKGKWRYLTEQVTTKTQYKGISGNWDRYLSRLLYAAGRKRDQLTRDVLLELLEKQNYRCALSGVELTCILEKGKRYPTNASVDRINPGGPYTKDNIQLVCRAVNSWRSDLPLETFIWFCQRVAETSQKRLEV